MEGSMMNCMKGFLGATLLLSSGLVICAVGPSRLEQNRKEMETILRWSPENPVTIAQLQGVLKRGVGDINEKFADVTPLELAVTRIAPEFTRLLLKAGANVYNPRFWKPLGFLLTNYDNSPFFANNIRDFKKGCAVLEVLIQNGLDINARDGATGETAFGALCSKVISGGATRQAAEYFLSIGANVNITDVNGKRPIDNALYIQNKSVVKVLAQQDLVSSIVRGDIAGIKTALLRGAQVGRQDRDGNNAFHIAAMKIADAKSAMVFKYLLALPVAKIGGYLRLNNHAGVSPMEMLILNGKAQDIVLGISQLLKPN